MSGSTSVSNAFNTGRDCIVLVRHPLAGSSGLLDLGIITDFDAKASYHEIKVQGLDGYTRTMAVPDNGTLSFSFDRTNPALDTFCWALWRSYKDTGRLPDGKVYQYVTELNGSVTTTEYTGVAFKVDDLGSYKKDSAITQKLTGMFMDARIIS